MSRRRLFLFHKSCHCDKDFPYFAEIKNPHYYNYHDNFPWKEYDSGFWKVVRNWFVSRTNFVFLPQKIINGTLTRSLLGDMSTECYTEGHEDCNLAFKAYYRAVSVHNYTTTVCESWFKELIVSLDYFCALEFVCGKLSRLCASQLKVNRNAW